MRAGKPEPGNWQLPVAGVDGLAEDAELVDASDVVFTTGLVSSLDSPLLSLLQKQRHARCDEVTQ